MLPTATAPPAGKGSTPASKTNLGWKLALGASGRAPAALFDSYSAERFPVIAEMLKLTTALYEKTACAAGDASVWTQASARGGRLGMLGVNTQGSTIVLADDGNSTVPAPGGAYGAVDAAAGRVQAGTARPMRQGWSVRRG
jgi:hypothetical protein